MPLSDPAGAMPMFVAAWPGIYTFSLRVNPLNSFRDYVEIIVLP